MLLTEVRIIFTLILCQIKENASNKNLSAPFSFDWHNILFFYALWCRSNQWLIN